MGVVPVVATENVAVCPVVTVVLTGCVVIAGAVTAALTIRMAVLLVTLPVELLTVTVNGLPLSEIAVAGVV